MKMIIAVGIGGTVGTFLRYLIMQAAYDPVFPFGTLIANWTGCWGLFLLCGKDWAPVFWAHTPLFPHYAWTHISCPRFYPFFISQ